MPPLRKYLEAGFTRKTSGISSKPFIMPTILVETNRDTVKVIQVMKTVLVEMNSEITMAIHVPSCIICSICYLLKSKEYGLR